MLIQKNKRYLSGVDYNDGKGHKVSCDEEVIVEFVTEFGDNLSVFTNKGIIPYLLFVNHFNIID